MILRTTMLEACGQCKYIGQTRICICDELGYKLKEDTMQEGDKLTRLRMENGAMGKEWYAAHTASKIAQACGRGMRHEEDYCENFILDGAFARLFDQHRNLFPEWFITQLK